MTDPRIREALTIAEDALRWIADPMCGVELDDDGHYIVDTKAVCRVAEGALRRMSGRLCDVSGVVSSESEKP